MENMKLFSIAAMAFGMLFTPFLMKAQTNDGFSRDALATLNNSENTRSFIVNVAEAGDYHARFWLMPAKYADGTYTTFKVYVNDSFAGVITPDKGNWQYAMIDDNSVLSLNSGDNVISVATAAPEMPEVQSVRLAENPVEATFSSDVYDAYLENAVNSDGTPEEDEVVYADEEFSTYSANGMIIRQNIPLKYSFYTTFSYTEGQEVTISSSSHVPHYVDIFYYGQPMPTSVTPQSLSVTPEIGVVPFNPKRFINYLHATSDEMQGLNWKGVSEVAANDQNMHIMTFRFTAPKSGYYMVKLRSAQDRVLSVADLNVNGIYYYEDAPVYYASVDCQMPADGTSYAAFTMCNNQGTDDPMLFVEGGNFNRVVGYNDDTPTSKRNSLDLHMWDSYIRQIYKVKTTALHVCNYSSSSPDSKCIVVGNVSEETEALNTVSMMPARAKAKPAPVISEANKDNSVSVSPRYLEQSSSVEISSKEKIRSIRVFNMAGTLTAACNVDDYCTTMPLSRLNISKKGVYLFNIETDCGSMTQKVLVR